MTIPQPPPPERTKVIACATVIEEMMPLMPPDMDYEVFDFGLHLAPENLKITLQDAIEKASRDYDTIILGYGLYIVDLTTSIMLIIQALKRSLYVSGKLSAETIQVVY